MSLEERERERGGGGEGREKRSKWVVGSEGEREREREREGGREREGETHSPTVEAGEVMWMNHLKFVHQMLSVNRKAVEWKWDTYGDGNRHSGKMGVYRGVHRLHRDSIQCVCGWVVF